MIQFIQAVRWMASMSTPIFFTSVSSIYISGNLNEQPDLGQVEERLLWQKIKTILLQRKLIRSGNVMCGLYFCDKAE